MNFDLRLENLLKKISTEEIDAVLISKTANLFYFSGFRGDSAVLLIGKNFRKLITDSRYTEQAEQQTKNFEIVKHTEGLFKKIEEEIKNLKIKKLGFEGKVLTFAEYSHLKENLTEVELKSVVLDELRQIKDAAEISLIRKACKIGDQAFKEILNFIKPNISEYEVAAELEYLMRKFGAEKNSFDTIVASGVRGSLPHGRATEKVIADGEFVTMDFGAVFNGYHSDMTRTVMVGRANDDQRRLYNILLDAQLCGLSGIRAGISGRDVDKKVRDFLGSADLEKYFTHGLGHGVGLEIHEEPRLSKLSDCGALRPNMVVTDEPGIYIPNAFHSPKHLIELNN